MTDLQKQQFNRMRSALIKIRSYQTPDQIRRNSEDDYGLEYEEALGMAYENMLTEASLAVRGIKEIK